MPVWQVDIYAQEYDIVPIRRGFVRADTVEEAGLIAAPEMGDAERAGLTPVIMPNEASLPEKPFIPWPTK